MKRSLFQILALLAIARCAVFAVQPEVVELSFDKGFEKPDVLTAEHAPEWMTRITQQGGAFSDEPHCWHVPATAAQGVGRLSISLDRGKIGGNLLATILFDADDEADLAVQLFDAQGRAVVLDLFGNLVDVGKEAKTNTFVIPLAKYPTAEQIVLRRINGDLKVYGIVLFPVVTEGVPVPGALQELARVLGDPLSPENPMVKGLRDVAKIANVTLSPPALKTTAASPQITGASQGTAPVTQPGAAEQPLAKYAAATRPPAGVKLSAPVAEGMVGHWDFAKGSAADSSGRNHHGRLRGGARIVDGLHGKALLLRKNPTDDREISWDSVTIPATPDLELKETMTVSAWVNFKSIAPHWGSQIVWFGDQQFGRDPWVLRLDTDGTIEFRSDRSVTGRPVFTVFESEIYLSPAGKPMMNQHVGVSSPKALAPGAWYFVAGTMEKFSPRITLLKLFINGEQVAEEKTAETVNYPTTKMWMSIGAVDTGGWQNFDGLIEDVRVYNRPLSPEEIKSLYQQPWASAR